METGAAGVKPSTLSFVLLFAAAALLSSTVAQQDEEDAINYPDLGGLSVHPTLLAVPASLLKAKSHRLYASRIFKRV